MSDGGSYALFGYRFRFETGHRRAAELFAGLYAPFFAEETPDEDVYRLGPSGDGGATWRIAFPDGSTRRLGSIQYALQTIEATICDRVIREPVGYHPMHTAALHGPTGGVLISGVSGAGKTTLTLALTRRGCQVAGDDSALLDEAGRLHAVPRCFHLDARSLELLAADGVELPAEPLAYDFITPRDLAGADLPPVRPRFAFLLEPERGPEPVLTPMPQAHLATALLIETGRGRATPLEGVTAIAGMAGGCRCYCLRSGPLSATADAVAEILAARG